MSPRSTSRVCGSYWFRSCLVQLNESRRCCFLRGRAALKISTLPAVPEGVEFVLEIGMGVGGIIRPRDRLVGFGRALSGFQQDALASSSFGTPQYPVRLRTGVARDTKRREVVASWLHWGRFGISLRRFAQEIGKCLFVTRRLPLLCIAQRRAASVQST